MVVMHLVQWLGAAVAVALGIGIARGVVFVACDLADFWRLELNRIRRPIFARLPNLRAALRGAAHGHSDRFEAAR